MISVVAVFEQYPSVFAKERIYFDGEFVDGLCVPSPFDGYRYCGGKFLAPVQFQKDYMCWEYHVALPWIQEFLASSKVLSEKVHMLIL